MMRVALILAAIVALRPVHAQPRVDTSRVVEMAPVVVTATRSAKDLEDVAVPTTVVSAEALRAQGALRLSEVLREVPGLALTSDHGTGVQIQGFDPDYTLILLDGEPIIGRTAGTLSLDRLAVAGLERVEVVRGPTSSLYGSEALAGVINLVPRAPAEGISATARTRYGTHGTTDLAATLEAGSERGGLRLLVNRYGSDGYDLAPEAFGLTTPRFTDYTADLRLRWDPTDRTALRLGGRLAAENQENAFALDEDGVFVPHDQTDQRLDWSLHPEIQHRFSRRVRGEVSLYAARYQTETEMERQDDGALYYEDDFDQRYGKGEVQLDVLWNTRHRTMLGGGGATETLGGDRYEDGPEAQSGFVFAQQEWLPSRLLELTVSARFDAHSDYRARLSPKAAVLVRPAERFRLRASAGSGFKAPDFRQLYLSFTNAVAGYSVFGTTRLDAGLRRLEAEGQIAEVFFDPASLETIRAENSVALNAGFTAEPVEALSLTLNAFYNDVHDLIDAQPIAQKTNGSFVFSYFNLDEVYTRGVETELAVAPGGLLRAATFSASYQFLQARDRNVVEEIEAGRVFGRTVDGRDVRLQLSDYGGLFGRSTHSGTVKATWRDAARGLTLTARGLWQSRYGYRDVDGNRIPNRDDEYVPGYATWNATLTKAWPVPFAEELALQLGVENLFDVTKPTLVPSMPGRTLYAGLEVAL